MEEQVPQLRICILVDRPRVSAFAEGTVLSGWDREFVEGKLRRAGFLPEEVEYVSISQTTREPDDADRVRTREHLNLRNPPLIVALDETALRFATGKSSISKWHLSPLDTLGEREQGAGGFTTRKCIPTFHPDQIKRQWDLGFYFERALLRARQESSTRTFERKPRRFHLHPRIADTFEILHSLEQEEHLSIDIETGRGQINTFGVAWSVSDALAINVLPDGYGAENYRALWAQIAKLCEGPAKKIFQNAPYETLYLSRYGIGIENIFHDTMVAQKFLYPEFDKGLDNVGRLYTNEPYWKDTGREASSEGGQRDWGNIRDWPRHYEYNCLDTSGTFEAAFAQRKDLEARGKLDLFDNYLMKFYGPVNEMSLRGLPVNLETKARLTTEHERRIEEIAKTFSSPINHRSPKQKLTLLKAKGYKIPKIKDKANDKYKESTNELSLKKLRLAHPEDADISALLEIAKLEKAVSSYLGADVVGTRVNYMLGIHGTETGRFSCTTDHLGMGFNAQTIPGYAKEMIEWPESDDRVFIQVDLKQAESRFVAYDTADENLIAALEDPKRDIHSEVAHEIIQSLGVDITGMSKEEFKSKWRQLGKKSGHSSNYDTTAPTLAEQVLKDMDLVLTKKESEVILASYHTKFPGVRRGHKKIQQKLWNSRKLTNPIGRERYFYGRMDAATFREAYAYLPQSTVPDVINHLMLKLYEERGAGKLNFWFHLQCHDSLVVSALTADVDPIVKYMTDTSLWHPEIILTAGRLIIPTSCEVGRNLKEMKPHG